MSRAILTILIVWGLLIMPLPVWAEPAAIIECADVSAFCKSLQELPAGQGFDTEEMRQFLEPIETQLKASSELLKAEFKIDVPALLNLLSGYVRLELDTGKPLFVLVTEPADGVDIKANVDLTVFLLKQDPGLDISSREENGATITVITEKRDRMMKPHLMLAFNAKRFAVGLAPMDQASTLAADYVNAAPAEKPAAGLTFRGNGQVTIPPLPMAGMDAQAMMNTLNMPGLAPVESRLFTADDRLAGTIFTKQDPGAGLCSLIKAGPVSDATLAWAHESAEYINAFHVDAAGLPNIIRAVLTASGNQQMGPVFDGLVAQIEMMIGVNIETGLFGTLGEEALFISYPSRKGGGFPLLSLLGVNSSALVLKLRDPEALKATISTLTPLISQYAQMDRVNGGFRSVDHKGTAITYLKLFSGMLSPCYAIRDGYMVMTTNVALMRHVLDTAGTAPLTATEDYLKTVKECGGSGGPIFAYGKPVSRPAIISAVGGTVPVIALAGFLLGFLTYQTEVARFDGPVDAPEDPVNVPAEFANLMNEDKWISFLQQELPKLGASVDFARFPAGNTFPNERKSNFMRLTLKDDGLLVERYMGYLGFDFTSGMLMWNALSGISSRIMLPMWLGRAMNRGGRRGRGRGRPGPPVVRPAEPENVPEDQDIF